MNLTIDHSCPQCGAPVSMDESDRLLMCGHCRVRLYVTSQGPFRYCLDVKNGGDDLLYLPYWRFRGIMYKAVPFKIDSQIVDATTLALPESHVPRSMGIRPQTLHMRFAARGVEGRFVRPVLPFPEALETIEKQIQTVRDDQVEEVYEKTYLGETASIVFAPFLVSGNTLVDAVLKKPVATLGPQEIGELTGSLAQLSRWSPRFLSAICPFCGWDLKGDKSGVVFVCKGCNSGWSPRGEEFRKILVKTIFSRDEKAIYLPFWRIEVETKGIKLKSYADMIRVANLPKAIRQEWETEPFSFWIPAFKVHPHLFLRTAKQVTLTPFSGEVEEKAPGLKAYPANLPLSEAAQSLKIVLATFGKPLRTIFQGLSRVHFKPEKATLVYAPFSEKASDLVQEELGIAISKQALYYGKDL
ncbi:MAG: hypothetical protein AB1921_02305 [Thermodesulfobacteriota bacterium]